MELFRRLRKSIKGQGLVEYGLILALVSVVAVGALGDVGDKVTSTFSSVGRVMDGGVYSEEEIADMVNNQGYVEISTPEGLQRIGIDDDKKLDGKYILSQNVDLKSISNFKPIGHGGNRFSGTFDGGGYTVRNLTVNNDSQFSGLFGDVVSAKIMNVKLDNVDVSGVNRSGGLAGRLYHSEVLNSHTSGSVHGDHDTGGLLGTMHNSKVVNSSSSVDVVSSSLENVGGLIGWIGDRSVVDQSYATGDVVGVTDVGGLVGNNRSGSTIKNSYATGNVEGNANVGGLTGYSEDDKVTISDSYSTGRVKGNHYVGGLIGRKRPSDGGTITVRNSFWDTDTSGIDSSADGLGKSSKAMKQKETFNGWDSSIWDIQDGKYPTLK